LACSPRPDGSSPRARNHQAGLDRLQQDDTQRACSAAHGRALPQDVAAKIERANLATIRYPDDGQLLGDWQNGERVAQEGRGKQFSDDPNGPVGANCYACHRLSPTELSFGTLPGWLNRSRSRRGCSTGAAISTARSISCSSRR